MNYIQDLPILIINGSWNYSIFNPEWVGKYLIPTENINVEYPLNFEGSLRFSTNDIRIFIVGSRLLFTAIKYTESSIIKLIDIANKIVDYLPHTPTTSFGVNFDFETKKSDELNKLFETSDENEIVKHFPNVITNEIKRTLKGDPYILNFGIIKNIQSGTFRLMYNYHFEISSLADFKNLIDITKFKDLNNLTIEMLNEVYKLNLENE